MQLYLMVTINTGQTAERKKLRRHAGWRSVFRENSDKRMLLDIQSDAKQFGKKQGWCLRNGFLLTIPCLKSVTKINNLYPWKCQCQWLNIGRPGMPRGEVWKRPLSGSMVATKVMREKDSFKGLKGDVVYISHLSDVPAPRCSRYRFENGEDPLVFTDLSTWLCWMLIK